MHFNEIPARVACTLNLRNTAPEGKGLGEETTAFLLNVSWGSGKSPPKKWPLMKLPRQAGAG